LSIIDKLNFMCYYISIVPKKYNKKIIGGAK